MEEVPTSSNEAGFPILNQYQDGGIEKPKRLSDSAQIQNERVRHSDFCRLSSNLTRSPLSTMNCLIRDA